MPDPDDRTIRALHALCTADAEHPDGAFQIRFQRAREILDTADPGDAESFVPDELRALEFIDEKHHVTEVALETARRTGWEPPPSASA